MSLSVDIHKVYPNFTLDAAFEAGDETLGLLGASGCGKSLTMRCIAGLEKPDKGRIVVADEVFFCSESGINLTPQQRKTALLFQDYQLFPNLTVSENIAAGIPKNTPKDELHRLVEEQLLRFGLKGFGKRYPIRLSGGQRQRVALARMLAAKPRILMLDEPFSALDSHLKSALEQDMLDLFDDYEGTILYVSHDIDEAFRFCDRIAVIDQGQIAELETPERIVAHPTALATLKVSGVKNISPARFVSEHEVFASDWGLVLSTAEQVPHNVAWLGVRASYVRLLGQEDKPMVNDFSLWVHRVSDSRFERTVMLDTRALPDTPGALVRASIQVKIDKLQHASVPLVLRGDTVRIHIPPERIYLICC